MSNNNQKYLHPASLRVSPLDKQCFYWQWRVMWLKEWHHATSITIWWVPWWVSHDLPRLPDGAAQEHAEDHPKHLQQRGRRASLVSVSSRPHLIRFDESVTPLPWWHPWLRPLLLWCGAWCQTPHQWHLGSSATHMHDSLNVTRGAHRRRPESTQAPVNHCYHSNSPRRLRESVCHEKADKLVTHVRPFIISLLFSNCLALRAEACLTGSDLLDVASYGNFFSFGPWQVPGCDGIQSINTFRVAIPSWWAPQVAPVGDRCLWQCLFHYQSVRNSPAVNTHTTPHV